MPPTHEPPETPQDAAPRGTVECELAVQTALRHIAETVASRAPLGEVVSLVLHEARRTLGLPHAVVWRFDHLLSGVVDGDIPQGETMSAPIIGDGRLWGAVAASTPDPESWRCAARGLPALARLVGFAVAADERERALAWSAAQHRALRRVSTAVVAEESRERVFGLAAEQAARLLRTEAGFVTRFVGDTVRVVGSWADARVVTADGDPLVITAPADYPLASDGVLSQVRATGRATHIDYGRTEGEAALRATAAGVVGAAAAPIHLGGRVWGAMVVTTRTPGRVGPDSEEQLAGFAEVLEMAVAAAASRELLVTETMAEIFDAPLSPDETLRRIAESARNALGGDRATCYVHDDLSGVVVRVVTTETDPESRRRIEWAIGRGPEDLPLWAETRRNPDPLSVFADLHNHPALPEGLARRIGAGSVLMFRLEGPPSGPEGYRPFLGTLAVSYRRQRRFGPRELAAARNLGGLAALTLAQARLHHETLRSLAMAEERATNDPLTGLLNHRAFQARLAGEVRRAARHGRPLAVALVDIDDFTSVNAEHGHEAGDRVLTGIAQHLTAVARPEDVVARVGGEEFAWILPECSAIDAWEVCERARALIARSEVGGLGRVTVSIGLAELGDAGSVGHLVRLAEGALYWAKEHGRDMTFRYSPDVVHVLSAQERADALQREQALASVRLLARVVDAKDPATQRHSERVAQLAGLLAERLGWDQERRAALDEAALVHDVGKIAVRDAVLFKPGRLTADEYAEVMQHAILGAKMVEEVLSPEQVGWVRGHHERVDGRGYPDGLVGDTIPDGARILAVADAFDVMTSARVYSAPMPLGEAMDEVRRMAGLQFDREVSAALEELWVRDALGPWDEASRPAAAPHENA